MTTLEFNVQYTKLKKDLANRAKTLTKDTFRAEDLVQETLLSAFKNLHQYKEGTNFKGWIMTIMRNNFINNYRKMKLRSTVEIKSEIYGEVGESLLIKEKASGTITQQELSEMLLNVPDMYRLPFEMHYQGYRYNEIADNFNLPLGTVKSRIHFARKAMKEAIAKNYQEYSLKLV